MNQTPANEELVAGVLDIIYRHPRHRELYYKALAFCAQERTVDEAEDYLEAQPEFASALQASTTLINVLIEEGGLAYREYDAQGTAITEESLAAAREAGVTKDELYEQVARRTVRTTSAGNAAVALLDPAKRVSSYVLSVPERTHVYRKLLQFCTTPRALDEIKALIDGDPALEPTARTSWQKLHAVHFIDRMDEAGGLVWNNGWVTTEAGRAFLDSVDDTK